MASVIEAAEQRTQTYVDRIKRSRASCVTKTDVPKDIFHYTTKHVGKVRDIYSGPEKVLLISTDRQSAFDRHLASIPFKGQVLNSTSAWWFEQIKHITKNHVIAVPHPSVTVGRKCTIFPVEFVMRGYLTGSTNTSILTHYTKGARSYCGHQLPDGLKKSQKLPQNLLTPTTKDDTHDELISAEEIVASGRMSKEDWEECARISHALFSYGQEVAASRGLILVDTKYEFGKDSDGNILLVDEIHTPDSSRYWLAGTYDEKFAKGEAPDNIDKEFLRLWFKEHCDPYKDEVLPDAPESLVVELSRRYILLYEVITGQLFPFPASDEVDEHTRIVESLRALSH